MREMVKAFQRFHIWKNRIRLFNCVVELVFLDNLHRVTSRTTHDREDGLFRRQRGTCASDWHMLQITHDA